MLKEKALNWNPDWSHSDCRFIEQNFIRLDARTFYVPPSGGYVGCINVHGRVMMTLASGYVEFKRDLAPADLPEPEWPGRTLSTFGKHVGSTRRMLTREQRSWNPDWSHSDCRFIEQNFIRLDARTFYVPPSGGYVGCINVHGRVVMILASGYVEFKRDLAPADLPDPEWQGRTLSTFRDRLPSTPSPDEGQPFCPIHHISLPVTGICDDCQ